MTERTHNEIYEGLGELRAEVRALRSLLESEVALSKKERREIADKVSALELINAERVGIDKGRSGATEWVYRVLRWMLPTIPYGAIAAFAVWLSHYWSPGAP